MSKFILGRVKTRNRQPDLAGGNSETRSSSWKPVQLVVSSAIGGQGQGQMPEPGGGQAGEHRNDLQTPYAD